MAVCPTKSSADERDYRILQLPNKLQVLLCSDAVAEKSSAAMDVHVGHFSDPEQVAGLAHFCEHMLFLGTEKYPDEAEYNQYLNQHGGMSNAYTSMENTNYYFDVQQEHFPGALDRFAQFFIKPLFTKDATDRELNAIESENSKNLQNDMWRSFQLEKSLSSPEHPFHKFGTGNNATLVDSPSANKIDIRDELLKFHTAYYSANLMKLCVLGREPLDELEAMVKDLFSAIPNTDAPQPSFSGTPYGPEQLGHTVRVVPIKEVRSLQMTWPLPPQDGNYETKPTRYLAHLLGHESAGSVLSVLKKEGLADGLSAGEGSAGSDFSSFTVSIELTEEGLGRVNDVASVVFQYIGMLQREGVSERVWAEEQDVAKMSFQFKEKEEPASATSRFAGWMQKYPAAEVFTGPYLFTKYDADLIQKVQDCLTVEACMLTISAKEVEEETDSTEKWYQTKYSKKKTQALGEFAAKMAESRDDLHLPAENRFIATNFDIKPPPENPSEFPVLIMDTPLMALWHKQDTTFGKPKGIIHVDLSTPHAYTSPTAAVLSGLFTRMTEDSLNEFAYAAEIAGLHYALFNTTEGMRIQISGYNDKISTLLEAILQKIASFDDWADTARFDLLKEQMRRQYANFFLSQPYEHGRYAQSQLLTLNKWHMKDYLDVIGPLTLPDLQSFTAGLLSQLKVTMLVGGNLSETDARAAATAFETTLTPTPLIPAQIPRARAIKLDPSSSYLYHFAGHNENEDNGATVLFYEVCHRNVRQTVSLDLLVQIANKPAFEILRTQQQLGYIVFTYKEQHQGVAGLGFIVQSNVQSPAVVDRRIEGFLIQLRQLVADMDDEEWASHIAAVVTAKTEPDKRLSQEIDRAWQEIVSKPATVSFNRRHVHAAAVQTITKAELISFFDHYIAAGAPQRSKLAIHTVSAKFAAEYESNPEGNEETAETGDAEAPSLAGPRGEVIVIPEDGEVAWKAGMEVHPAVRDEDDGLTAVLY